MLDSQAIEKFTNVYFKYFGKEVKVELNERGYIRLSGRQQQIWPSNLSSIAMFYNWRMNRSKFSNDDFDYDDFNYLESLLSHKLIGFPALSSILKIGESSLRRIHGETGSILQSFNQIVKNIINKKPTRQVQSEGIMIEWEGEIKTQFQWAKDLGLSKPGFRFRYKRFGICYITFLTKEEYFKVSKEEKEKHTINIRVQKRNSTFKSIKRESLDDVEPDEDFSNPNFVLKKLIPQNVTLDSVINLVSGLIQDSKENLIEDTLVSKKYFDDSRRFLMNGGGMLEAYLACIPDIDVEVSLKALYEFADYGYLKEKEKHISRGGVGTNTLRSLL